MAFGNGRDMALQLIKAETENKFLKERVEDLANEKDNLSKQVKRLQESLIATKAPESYKMMKMDEIAVETNDFEPVPESATTKVIREYVASFEEPLWKNGDEMVSVLSQELSKGPSSLHENDES